MAKIDCFAITKNEEEQVSFMLDTFALIREMVGVISIVDNGSSDNTLNIIQSYKDKGLPIEVQENYSTPHHGQLRTQALSICKSPWIFYLDADETATVDLLDWFKRGHYETADVWDFYKYSTIIDRYHYTEGGNGPSTRMFRNVPGVHFSQEIHTYPEGVGLNRKAMAENVLMFDHTGCKSREALWAKGVRYNWAFGKVIGIGPNNEYCWRVDTAIAQNNIHEFSNDIKSRIFTGPSKVTP